MPVSLQLGFACITCTCKLFYKRYKSTSNACVMIKCYDQVEKKSQNSQYNIELKFTPLAEKYHYMNSI